MSLADRYSRIRNVLSGRGMVLVLLLLCAFFGVVTCNEQHPTGTLAARQLADAIAAGSGGRARVMIVVRSSDEDAAFAAELRRQLEERGVAVVATVRGQPADARLAMSRLGEQGERIT